MIAEKFIKSTIISVRPNWLRSIDKWGNMKHVTSLSASDRDWIIQSSGLWTGMQIWQSACKSCCMLTMYWCISHGKEVRCQKESWHQVKLSTRKTRSCPWHRFLEAGQNLKLDSISHHYSWNFVEHYVECGAAEGIYACVSQTHKLLKMKKILCLFVSKFQIKKD